MRSPQGKNFRALETSQLFNDDFTNHASTTVGFTVVAIGSRLSEGRAETFTGGKG
jgi:hypothetical protein